MRFVVALLSLFSAALVPAAPAFAVDVVFGGVVINLCALVPTPGTLGNEGDGRTLSSEGVGGVGAVLSVIATGGLPTLTFGAPTATTPNGFTGTATPEISYTSTGGISQILTSTSTSRRLNGLIDLITIRGRITGSEGFNSGTYGLKTVVTCQQ